MGVRIHSLEHNPAPTPCLEDHVGWKMVINPYHLREERRQVCANCEAIGRRERDDAERQ